MTTPQKKRLLIADDHYILRAGLADVISDEPDLLVAGQASNGRQAIDLFQQLRPDLAILDLRMPVIDGLQALTQIRRIDPLARVLVLTTYNSLEEIHLAINAGAAGYVLKRDSGDEFIPAVRAVLRGERWIPPGIASLLQARNGLEELTDREMDVLKRLALGDGNKEIASALHISAHTTKTHVTNLLAKLNARDRTEAVVTAFRRGIIRLPEE